MFATETRDLRLAVLRLQDCAHYDTPIRVREFFVNRAKGKRWWAALNPGGGEEQGSPGNL